jgi:hypothetical protein
MGQSESFDVVRLNTSGFKVLYRPPIDLIVGDDDNIEVASAEGFDIHDRVVEKQGPAANGIGDTGEPEIRFLQRQVGNFRKIAHAIEGDGSNFLVLQILEQGF